MPSEVTVGEVYRNTTGAYTVVAVTPRRVRLRVGCRQGFEMPHMSFETWRRMDNAKLQPRGD